MPNTKGQNEVEMNKKNAQLAANAIDFGNETTNSLATLSFEGKNINGANLGMSHMDVSFIPSKPGLLTGGMGFGISDKKVQLSDRSAPSQFYYSGIQTTPRIIKTGAETGLDGLPGRDGIYLNSSAVIDEHLLASKGQPVSEMNFTGYTGVKYIGDKGRLQADAGVKFNKAFEKGRVYEFDVTKRFIPKAKDQSSYEDPKTTFYVKAGAAVDYKFQKIEPRVTFGINIDAVPIRRHTMHRNSGYSHHAFSY